ncbi:MULTISPECIES: VOC family protein [unclassified Lactococcus]|uniref:VOC family protein n=1 Tax=unclassified Lactococcus TaxID=2643510 RepID=UPI0011C9C534|nr:MULTISPECIES: VOC family protein [unclassified Lactococcus]MQW23367.1 hypothetical protein [Lactococcus sp. dk101]TXK37932.1 VOC family protein [Lactococcus sp. dk310]TXK49586.1 VOC family protein [Lactococcus sp. dk322]
MTTLHKKGLPAWVEVAADDTKAAVEFYTSLFGWTSQSIGDENFEYHILLNNGKTVGGLSGKMNPYQPTQWLTYLETDDIEKTISEVTENGGQIYMPATDMPGGKFTVASDPAGSPFGIVEGTGMNEALNEVGGICWYELELNKAFNTTVDFYSAVFGWQAHTEIDTPEMTYLTVRQMLGIYTGPDFPAYFKDQSQWSVTFAVEDVEAIAKTAEGLGATVEAVRTGTPYGDFAMLRDPQGAFFVAMKPNLPSK